MPNAADPNSPQALLANFQRVLGNWWTDGRQKCCAYCGIALTRTKGGRPGNDGATRDHVIPRAEKGRFLTIPACRACNQKRGSLDLLEFLHSPSFVEISKRAGPARWSTRDL